MPLCVESCRKRNSLSTEIMLLKTNHTNQLFSQKKRERFYRTFSCPRLCYDKKFMNGCIYLRSSQSEQDQVHPRIKKVRNKEPLRRCRTELTKQLVVSLSQLCILYCRVAVKACYEIIGSFEPLEERSTFACQFVFSHSQCLV